MIDGEMVRRIAIEIDDYYESSLVWLGADPYAKMLDKNGEVVNIDRSSVVLSKDNGGTYDKDPYKKFYKENKKFYVFDCQDPRKILDLERWSAAFNKSPQQNANMDPILKLIAKKLGINPDQVTPEMLEKYSFVTEEELTKLKQFEKTGTDILAKDTEITQLKKDVSDKDTELTQLKADKAKLEKEANDSKPAIEFGQQVILSAKKFVKGKTEQAILDEIDASSLQSLDAKIKMWGGSMYERFGAHCNKCNSTDIDFRSSINEENEDTNKSERPVLAEFVRQ
jgi:hypothetical protein